MLQNILIFWSIGMIFSKILFIHASVLTLFMVWVFTQANK